ncbi:unnamed protein product [Fusarium graminearum]|nr:unnamed protein product [Fusarium graminearum]
MLEDDGVMHLQIACIRQAWQYEDLVWGLFMNKYVFPGVDASTPLAYYIGFCERAGWEVKSVDTISVHYSATIWRWYRNWLANEADVTAKYGLRWFKIWKYFLASATTSSRQGSATCYQITLVKNINSVRRIDGVSTQFALSTALEAMFNRERISDLECVERHVQNLLPLLDTEGQTVEIKDLFLRFTLDMSADFTLGVDLDTLKRPLNRFAESFERLRHWKIQKERSNPFKFLVLRSRYQADLDYIESFMDPIIMETVNEIKAEEAGETPHKKDSGFNLLGASAEVSTNRRFLRDELLTALFAGRDNTAMAFTWILYELAQHPDVVRDMRREIDAQIGLNSEPGYKTLKDMRILSNIINETLRLYPPVPLNTRACLKDT